MNFLLIIGLFVSSSLAASRTRRAAYEFADGVDEVVGQIRTTFQCPQRYGYFADVDNDCKVYHVCNPIKDSMDMIKEVQHYSFFCGNQTVFDQLTLTCSHPEEAVPCHNAPDFFYVNDKIGEEESPFLTDADIQRAAPLIPGYGPPAASGYAASNHHYAYAPSHYAAEEHQEPQYYPYDGQFGQRARR